MSAAPDANTVPNRANLTMARNGLDMGLFLRSEGTWLAPASDEVSGCLPGGLSRLCHSITYPPGAVQGARRVVAACLSGGRRVFGQPHLPVAGGRRLGRQRGVRGTGIEGHRRPWGLAEVEVLLQAAQHGQALPDAGP